MGLCKRDIVASFVLGISCITNSAWAGLVYVSNFTAGTVSVVPSGGGAATTFASGIVRPEGIVVAPSGTIYVSSQGDIHDPSQIDAISGSGVVTPFAAISASGVSGLGAMTIDSIGNLYVSLQNDSQIEKVSPSGVVSSYVTGVGNPQGLAFDRFNDLFVADYTDSQVDEVTPNGGAVSLFKQINHPTGIATDSLGDVFVSSNSSDGYIEEFSPTGLDLGDYANVPNPWGLSFDAAGDLLVSSTPIVGGGDTIYTIPPGGGTPVTYATGLSTPYYFAVSSVVPEPGSVSLLFTATLGLLSCRRKRRQKVQSHRLDIK